MSDYSLPVLLLMVLILGIRHGFDLDHLATIDAISRATKDNRRLSKWVGVLFSLGHGLVVVMVSLLIGSGILKAVTPNWLETFGQWVSIGFLLAFGLLTIYMLRSKPSTSMFSSGPKSIFLKRLSSKASNPYSIILVGALFAVSFDTITQVALFSISASVMSVWLMSGFLGLLFMSGMMISDGLNGYVISSLIYKADKKSRIAANVLGLSIAGFSLILGIMALMEQLNR